MGLKFTKKQVCNLKDKVSEKYSDFAALYNKLVEKYKQKINITPKIIIPMLYNNNPSPKLTYKLQNSQKAIKLVIAYNKEKNNYVVNLCAENNRNESINIKNLLNEIMNEILKPLQDEYKQYYIAEKYYNEFQKIEMDIIKAIKTYNDKVPSFIKKEIIIKT